jgi:hypothetical protein
MLIRFLEMASMGICRVTINAKRNTIRSVGMLF